jgi:hypothetical protein
VLIFLLIELFSSIRADRYSLDFSSTMNESESRRRAPRLAARDEDDAFAAVEVPRPAVPTEKVGGEWQRVRERAVKMGQNPTR